MCGRYTFTKPSDIVAMQFQVEVPLEIMPRYNIAPTQVSLIVRERIVNNRPKRELAAAQWGLVPSWAKDPSIGSRMINARSETLREKPSFRGPFKYRRCLVPADGFYEWQTVEKSKYPFHIGMRDRSLFAFAGLWEEWEQPEGYLETFTIITTEANEKTKTLHDRMPVILEQRDYAEWLNPYNQKSETLEHLFQSYPATDMEIYPVSTAVNRAGVDSPELIVPHPERY